MAANCPTVLVGCSVGLEDSLLAHASVHSSDPKCSAEDRPRDIVSPIPAAYRPVTAACLLPTSISGQLAASLASSCPGCCQVCQRHHCCVRSLPGAEHQTMMCTAAMPIELEFGVAPVQGPAMALPRLCARVCSHLPDSGPVPPTPSPPSDQCLVPSPPEVPSSSAGCRTAPTPCPAVHQRGMAASRERDSAAGRERPQMGHRAHGISAQCRAGQPMVGVVIKQGQQAIECVQMGALRPLSASLGSAWGFGWAAFRSLSTQGLRHRFTSARRSSAASRSGSCAAAQDHV